MTLATGVLAFSKCGGVVVEPFKLLLLSLAITTPLDSSSLRFCGRLATSLPLLGRATTVDVLSPSACVLSKS